MAPRLSWRQDARHHTTLGRERSWTLRYGRLVVARAGAAYDLGKFVPRGYWWTAGNDELRIPQQFASESALLPMLDEAKAVATEYVRNHLPELYRGRSVVK